MGIKQINLTDRERNKAIEEVESDIKNNKLFISPRLNEKGKQLWPEIIKNALKEGNDDSLSAEILNRGLLNTLESNQQSKTGGSKRVPINANQTLSESEFNRYIVRGRCIVVLEDGEEEVEVCRGKEAKDPRSESENIIGKRLKAAELLKDLRNNTGLATDLGIGRPNSGLTVKRIGD